MIPRDPDLADTIAAERAEHAHLMARRSDPATSHAAARRAAALVSEHEGRILFALRFGGPGTSYDIAYRCVGMTQVQVARRMSELEASGKAKRTGATKQGPNSRACEVWSLA